ncbi:MAG: efflux RND transporter periplasmic adaptor subunit [Deltaproteobacteria bacterium]|nr:efflux RND transporter periplasmic adaptor subunit [Deltaproteobacteria bacterium]
MVLNISGCTSQGGEKKDATAGKIPTAVETVSVTVGDMSRGVDVVGTLAPKFEADVKSEYLGVVTEIYVTEWVRVKKGTPLAKLDTREADNVIRKMQANLESARAGLLEAEAAGDRAEREYERSRKLKEAGLITQQNLEDAQTGKSAAQARVSAARAQITAAEEDLKQTETRLAKAIIRAPMDGVISLRTISVGDLVGEMGTPKVMFKIVDNRLLDLIVNVPSFETDMLKVGQPLVFSTDAAPGKIFRGQVKFINPSVSSVDRSVQVIAEVPNVPEALKGGLFVQGKIIIDQRKGVRQVPRPALVSWEMAAKRGKLLVAENGVARLRKVQTGIIAGDMVEITGGLASQDRIILRGGFNVQDGGPVKIVGNQGGD